MDTHKDTPTKTSFSDILDKYDNFFFDCEGVFYNSTNYIQEAYVVLNKLKELNKNIFFITNNSRNTRKEVCEKIRKGGFEPDFDKVYSSGYLAAKYFTTNHPEVKKVYAVGVDGLRTELEAEGLKVVGAEQDSKKDMDMALFNELEVEEDIQAVVVGLDYGFNYYKLCYASILLHRGVPFIAANFDSNSLMKKNKMPGCGCIVKAIEYSCGVKPILVGKPDGIVIDIIIKSFGLDRSKCIMTGDRLDSDILLGKNANIGTFLVLSGVTSEEELLKEKQKENGIIPDYYWRKVEL